MAYLATNEFAGTGAVMQVEINFTGNRPDASSGTTPYFKVGDVLAEIVTPSTSAAAGSAVAVGLTSINANTFRTVSSVPVGKLLRIYRKTEDKYALVDFNALQTVTESNLDTLIRQAVFMSGEAKDQAAIGRSDASSAVVFSVLANTNANTAVSAANAAINTANGAVGTANGAASVANNAAAAAGAAVTTANGASSNAATAVSTANSAAQTANTAAQQVAGAVNASNQAVADSSLALARATEAEAYVGEVKDAVANSPSAAALAVNLGDGSTPSKGAALVGLEGTDLRDVALRSLPLLDYAALRAYTGTAASVRLTKPGLVGELTRIDSGPADDNMTTFVASNGVTWRRTDRSVLKASWAGLGDGVTTDNAALTLAYNVASSGQTIQVNGPGPWTPGTITGTKYVVWALNYDVVNNTSMLSLPGVTESTINKARMSWVEKGGASDFAQVRYVRKANYTGGAGGGVNSLMHLVSEVEDGTATFEWTLTAINNNKGQGQNVAGYFQGNRRATNTNGGTFAAVAEARDYTLQADPTNGLIGIEVDILANGTDANGLRVGNDTVVGKGVSTGATCEAFAGYRVGPSHGDVTQGTYKHGFIGIGLKENGFTSGGQTSGRDFQAVATGGVAAFYSNQVKSTADFWSAGNSAIGILLGGTYTSGLAARMNAGQALGLENTGNIKFLYSAAVQGWSFTNGATEKANINTSTGAYSVQGLQVVGTRATGWGAVSGTLSRAAYATYTAPTLTALMTQAEQQALANAVQDASRHIAAMITDNRAHGLYGN